MQGSSYTDADGSACEESTHWKTTAMARPGAHSKRPALHGGDLNEDSE